MTKPWHIGQTVPLERKFSVMTDQEIDPVWHPLLVPPQKDRATKKFFKAQGCMAFYPTEWRTTFRNGKKISTERPSIASIVYVQFKRQPNWYAMREKRKLIRGVICNNGQPIRLHSDVIRRLQGLPVEAEAIQKAIAEMMLPVPGEKYTILKGPFEGFAAEIEEVKGARGVWWVEIFGRKTPVEGDLSDLDFTPDEEAIARARAKVQDEMAEVS